MMMMMKIIKKVNETSKHISREENLLNFMIEHKDVFKFRKQFQLSVY